MCIPMIRCTTSTTPYMCIYPIPCTITMIPCMCTNRTRCTSTNPTQRVRTDRAKVLVVTVAMVAMAKMATGNQELARPAQASDFNLVFDV